MIPIKSSNTKSSSIIAMGERLANAATKTGKEYLLLNRGVNSVVNIDINKVVKEIDFNSDAIQVYPGSKGKANLRNAINKEYFNDQANTKNILITGGGISGLDIAFQNINVDEILLPNFFWGTYVQILNLRNINFSSYKNYETLIEQGDKLKGKAIIICDPGNPLGEKHDDKELLKTISTLNKAGAIILFDSPYRRLFLDNTDTFYQQLLQFYNVVIIESFSKSIGLSGQRIGFIHCSDENFIKEATLRISYATNGINGFAQTLVSDLLFTELGKKAVSDFKLTTTTAIAKNIKYIKDHKLLANDFYDGSISQGIFAVVNKSTEELFTKRIGSVSLNYFTLVPNIEYDSFSRILLAIPHEKFVSFFRTLK